MDSLLTEYKWNLGGIFDFEEIFTGKPYATGFKEHVTSTGALDTRPLSQEVNKGVSSQQVTFAVLTVFQSILKPALLVYSEGPVLYDKTIFLEWNSQHMK